MVMPFILVTTATITYMFLLLVNHVFAVLVELNILWIELILLLENLLIVLIDILLLLFIMIYGLFFNKIGLYLIYSLMLFLLLFFLGFMNKIIKKTSLPGFISTLHTFGRDLKWNPHIHVLITEGASGNFTPWKKFEIFPYVMLRNRFQTTLLALLEKHFGKHKFKSLKNHIFKTSSNGFYVHAPKIKARNIKSTVKYVIRYSGKPAMAQSRILNYDGKLVTFWYNRHEDNQRIEETIHAYDFIKRLIIHIYDKYFNVVRYYGLYAKKHKNSDKFIHMLKPHVAEVRKKLQNWQCRIILYFKHDPLVCSCGHTFHFDYLVQKSYNTS